MEHLNFLQKNETGGVENNMSLNIKISHRPIPLSEVSVPVGFNCKDKIFDLLVYNKRKTVDCSLDERLLTRAILKLRNG